MSNVWGMRYRLLGERLEKLAQLLGDDKPITPDAAEEQLVRLAVFALILVKQHHVTKRGKCQYCGWTQWKWRFWHPRPRCTVCQALDFAMSQSLDVVWWQFFSCVGQKTTLDKARQWVEERAVRGNS